MSSKVVVSYPKPGFGRVLVELVHAIVGVVFDSPAFVWVNDACKRVGYDVNVRANVGA